MSEPRELRVVMLASSFPPVVGGIQNYAYEVARHLDARCRLCVVAPRSPGCAAFDRTHELEIMRWPALAGDDLAFAGIAPLVWLLRRRRFDAGFATHWAPAFALESASKLAGQRLPVSIAIHGKELMYRPLAIVPPAQALYDRIRLRALRGGERFLPVSRRTAELAIASGVPRERITVVHNGVDPERYCPRDASALRAQLSPHGPIVLSVARLVPRKGIDTMLRAHKELVARLPSLIYAIVGEGPDRARLERLARELGIDRSVRFLGRVGDVVDYYNACDVFVLPAREEPNDIEGFGLVFLEAGACGKASVGARAGGVVDAIVDGVTGVLVPPDDPSALANALTALLGDPERCATIGHAAREHVLRECTWRHAADAIYAAIEATLAGYWQPAANDLRN